MKKLITKNILIVLSIVFIISLSTVLFIEKNNKKLSSEVVDRKIDNRSLITSSDNEDNTIKDDNEPNKDMPTNKEIKEEEQNISKNNNSNNKEEIALETKTEVPSTNNSVIQTTTNDDSSNIDSSNDSNNNTDNNNSNNEIPPSVPEQPPIVEDNSVRTNDIFYRIHKGRIDYTDLDTCQSETFEFYFNYLDNISNLIYLEVMSNSDKILGYFVEYVFKEASYNNYEECNNIGNSIKSSLSDRVTSYQCTERDNSYYLKIFTDYE